MAIIKKVQIIHRDSERKNRRQGDPFVKEYWFNRIELRIYFLEIPLYSKDEIFIN